MLNEVLLIGYAGADSEMKFTAAGIPVANFSLAVKDVAFVNLIWPTLIISFGPL